MNKESLIAIIFGLGIGIGLFFGLSRLSLLMDWLRFRNNLKSISQPMPTRAFEPTIIKTPTISPHKRITTKVLSGFNNFFLVNKPNLDVKLKTASGSSFLVRVNKDLKIVVSNKNNLDLPLRLESGSNFIELFELNDDLSLSRLASISGIVTSKKYPHNSLGSFGLIKSLKANELEIETPTKILFVKIQPESRLYFLNKEGRLVSLTKLSDDVIGKYALVIFSKNKQNEYTAIKLIINTDVGWSKLSWFKGKVTKIDDNHGICQLANTKNEVKEIKLNDLEIRDIDGRNLKITDVGLASRVLVFYLNLQPKLVLVAPEINLIK